jgi:hypothetical protein
MLRLDLSTAPTNARDKNEFGLYLVTEVFERSPKFFSYVIVDLN